MKQIFKLFLIVVMTLPTISLGMDLDLLSGISALRSAHHDEDSVPSSLATTVFSPRDPEADDYDYAKELDQHELEAKVQAVSQAQNANNGLSNVADGFLAKAGNSTPKLPTDRRTMRHTQNVDFPDNDDEWSDSDSSEPAPATPPFPDHLNNNNNLVIENHTNAQPVPPIQEPVEDENTDNENRPLPPEPNDDLQDKIDALSKKFENEPALAIPGSSDADTISNDNNVNEHNNAPINNINNSNNDDSESSADEQDVQPINNPHTDDEQPIIEEINEVDPEVVAREREEARARLTIEQQQETDFTQRVELPSQGVREQARVVERPMQNPQQRVAPQAGTRQRVPEQLPALSNQRDTAKNTQTSPALPHSPRAQIEASTFNVQNILISAGLLGIFSWIKNKLQTPTKSKNRKQIVAEECITFAQQAVAANCMQQLLARKPANTLAFTTTLAFLHACELGVKKLAATLLNNTKVGKKIAHRYTNVSEKKRAIFVDAGSLTSWIIKTVVAYQLAS